MMSGVTFKTSLKMDEKAVRKAMRKSAPTSLKRAGAYVRAVAKNSLKRRKDPDKHSPAGSPPFDHGGGNHAMTSLKKSVLFSLESSKRSVVVGPTYIKGGLGNVARLHEFGGSKTIKAMNMKDYNRVFKVGDRGPITSKNFKGGTDRAVRITTLRDPLSGNRVVYIRLRTAEQAKHATRLNKRLRRAYAKTKIVNYKARPFMGPALEKSRPQLSKFWANAIKA